MGLSRLELRASKMPVAGNIPMALFLVSLEKREQIEDPDALHDHTTITQILG
jgi:hypothetical protein